MYLIVPQSFFSSNDKKMAIYAILCSTIKMFYPNLGPKTLQINIETFKTANVFCNFIRTQRRQWPGSISIV